MTAPPLERPRIARSVRVPVERLRRLRRTPALRALVRETRLDPAMLLAPLFIRPGVGVREPIESLPGQFRVSPDEAVRDADRLAALGVGGILLFGLPPDKDEIGTGAWIEDGVVQQALRRLHDAALPLVLVADTCLCEYTSHGHCGPLRGDGSVDNDGALASLAETAVAQAEAGADIVAPSAMMDGQVAAIRAELDAAGRTDTAIMAYAAKAASAFYGPFRDAVGTNKTLIGDKRTYQMDPANSDEALREVEQDIVEGADMVMVKPGLPYLDIVRRVKDTFGQPTFAYQVSGEYAMIMAAAGNGWLDGERAMMESLLAFKRAGADGVLTYFAVRAAEALRNG
jgi:porphobilinogen synthase